MMRRILWMLALMCVVVACAKPPRQLTYDEVVRALDDALKEQTP
jgi:hypothetical protein